MLFGENTIDTSKNGHKNRSVWAKKIDREVQSIKGPHNASMVAHVRSNSCPPHEKIKKVNKNEKKKGHTPQKEKGITSSHHCNSGQCRHYIAEGGRSLVAVSGGDIWISFRIGIILIVSRLLSSTLVRLAGDMIVGRWWVRLSRVDRGSWSVSLEFDT